MPLKNLIDEFIRYLLDVRGYSQNSVKTYHIALQKMQEVSHFYDEDGKCLVAFIGKIENIEKDFEKICERIKIKAEIPHVNKSEHKNYREYYNEETKNLIAKHFAEDIEMFDYSF